MANEEDVIAGSSPAHGFDMATGKTSVYASPSEGVVPDANPSDVEANEADAASVLGTGANVDTTDNLEDQ